MAAWHESLRELPPDGARASLDILETLLRKTSQYPGEEKYRKIRYLCRSGNNFRVSRSTLIVFPGNDSSDNEEDYVIDDE